MGPGRAPVVSALELARVGQGRESRARQRGDGLARGSGRTGRSGGSVDIRTTGRPQKGRGLPPLGVLSFALLERGEGLKGGGSAA